MQRAVMRAGTPITVEWTEWPDGKPEEDPTTGATLATDEQAPVTRSCETRALVHSVQATTSALRMHAELEVGDAILDFATDFLRVLDEGDTALVKSGIVDRWAFNAANRAEDVTEPAAGVVVSLTALEDASFVIDGERWVQKGVGAGLAKSWDVRHAGVTFAETIAVRKAT